MGPLELPAPQEANDSVDQTNEALSDNDQLQNMFKVPTGVLVSQDPPLSRPQLDPQVLMAQAKLKSGQQTLPPPPELRAQKDDPDTWNVVLRAIQTPKVTDTQVKVADPRNKDPLYWTGMLTEIKPCRQCKRGAGKNPTPVVWGLHQAVVSATGVAADLGMKPAQRGVDKCPQRTRTLWAPWPVSRNPAWTEVGISWNPGSRYGDQQPEMLLQCPNKP